MQPYFSIYEFSKPVEFLSAVFQEKQKINPRFSLRAWAKQMGFSSPALLSMILNNKRRIHPTQVLKIRKSIPLSENESRYFDILILYSNSKSLEEKEYYENVLKTLKPDNEFSSLELDQFRLIADWYHIALLELIKHPHFHEDSKWISKKLIGNISPSKIEEALKRLVRLKLIAKNEKNKWIRVNKKIATSTDIPHEGLRRFHSQMIQNALLALEEHSVNERDITSQTILSSISKLQQAKKMIRVFRRKLCRFLDIPRGEDVFQLNVQLFKLTQQEAKK